MAIDKKWYMRVSERIRFAMKEQNLSKEKLAETSGLNIETVTDWMNADFKNRWLTDIVQISKALSVEPQYFLMDVTEEDVEKEWMDLLHKNGSYADKRSK